MPGPPTRSNRRDAVRNRQRLLDAAKEVFAAQGLTATLDDIAKHAGVGAGTAYRHFGSRREITVAIFSEVAQSFIADAEQALAIAEPWPALVSFVEAFAARQSEDRGLHQVFACGDHFDLLPPEDWIRLIGLIATLVERAKASGEVREDIGPGDVIGLFAILGPAYDLSVTAKTPLWRRHVDLFLRSIHKDAPDRVIAAPPSIDMSFLAQLGGDISSRQAQS